MDRDFINEICKWGLARLVRDTPDPSFSSAECSTQNDGRWTSLVNGLAIAEEIRVFKEKLTAGRELLLVRYLVFHEGRRT
jgi:hypothetical protein